MRRKMNVKGKAKRVLAASLVVVMMSAVTDWSEILTVNARENTDTDVSASKTITEFKQLDEDVSVQSVKVGGKESDISFPDTLEAVISSDDKNIGTEDTSTQTTTEDTSTQTTTETTTQTTTPTTTQTTTENTSTQTTTEDTSTSSFISALSQMSILSPMKVYAKENTSEGDTSTEDSTVSGITWKIDAEKSAADKFSSEKSMAGKEFTYQAVLPDDYELADGVTMPTITVTVTSDGFFQEIKTDDAKITIEAPEGVFPSDAYATAEPIKDEQKLEKIKEAIEKDGDQVEELLFFDVNFFEKGSSEEIQPDKTKGDVTVTIVPNKKEQKKLEEKTDADDSTIKGYHLNDALTDATRVDKTAKPEKTELVVDHFSPVGLAASSEDDSIDITKGHIEINSKNKEQYNNKILTGTKKVTDLSDLYVDPHVGYYGGWITIDGISINLTIKDVNLSYAAMEAAFACINLTNNATLNLTLEGDNVMKGVGGGAGIRVPEGCTLKITSESTGTLSATGGDYYGGGAGIGANGDNWNANAGNNREIQTVGTIEIAGGTVTAKGGTTYAYNKSICGAAGIGGSTQCTTGHIIISGGNVTATSGYISAGIGGGDEGYVEDITITGGTIIANATGTDYQGAAIGSGYNGYTLDTGNVSCGTITISGGDITARGNIGYGKALVQNQNVGGSVRITGTPDIKFIDGKVDPADYVSQIDLKTYIYDERLEAGTDTVTVSFKNDNGTVLFTKQCQMTVGDASNASLELNIITGSIIGQSGTLSVTDGNYKWEKAATLSADMQVTIGNKLKLQADIYDYYAGFKEGTETATVLIKDGDNKLLEKQCQMSVDSEAHASLTLDTGLSEDIKDKSVTVSVTDEDGNTWNETAVGSEDMSVTFGKKLYPVTLIIKSEKVTGDITIGKDALSVTNTDNDFNSEKDLYIPELQIKKTHDSTGQMIIYLPAGEGYDISLQCKKIQADAMTKEDVSVAASDDNSVIFVVDMTSALDIANGDIKFGKENDKFYLSYYKDGESEPTKQEWDELPDDTFFIKQSNPETTTEHSIDISGLGTDAALNLKIADLNIKKSGASIKINGSKVNLHLRGTNYVEQTFNHSADACVGGTDCQLNIDGGGELDAVTYGFGAGIGSGKDKNATVTISGGIVNGTGYFCGAGIGSGFTGNATVKISGGTVKGKGSANSVGIGNGYNGGAAIIIDGGTVSGVGACTSLTNAAGKNVYKMTADLSSDAGKGQKVDNASITDYDYGFDDVYTDGNGKIYVYLPLKDGNTETTARFMGNDYTGTVKNDHSGIFTFKTEHSTLSMDVDSDSITYKSAVLDFKTKKGAVIYYVQSATPLATAEEVKTAAAAAGNKTLTADAYGKATVTIDSLSENTAYHYYAAALYNNDYSQVADKEFTTKALFKLTGSLKASGLYGQSLANVSVPELTAGSKVVQGNSEVTGTWAVDSTQKINGQSVAVENIYPEVDGTASYQATFTPSDGYDNYGNILTASVTPDIKYLSVRSSVKASLTDTNKGANGWFIGDATLQAPTGYYISTSNAAASFGTNSKITITSSKTAPVYYLRDASTGNETSGGITAAMTADDVKIDKTAPAVDTDNIAYKQGADSAVVKFLNWIIGKEVITVTIPVTDTESGVKKAGVKVTLTPDSGTAKVENLSVSGNQTDGYKVSFTIPEDFCGTYAYTIKDQAGNSKKENSQPVNGEIVTDNTLPQVTVTPSGTAYQGENDAYSSAVNVKISVDDTKDGKGNTLVSSGLKSISYTVDGSNEVNVITPAAAFDSNRQTSYTDMTGFTVNKIAGVHTVNVTVIDQAGNAAQKDITFRIIGEPQIKITPNISGIVYDGASVKDGADFTLDKGGSEGTASYAYRIAGSGDDYTDGLPAKAGAYQLKVSVASDIEHGFTEAVYETKDGENITIQKADAVGDQEKVGSLGLTQGKSLKDMTLPSGFRFADETDTDTIHNTLGEVLTPDVIYNPDPDNYNDSERMQASITVTAVPAEPANDDNGNNNSGNNNSGSDEDEDNDNSKTTGETAKKTSAAGNNQLIAGQNLTLTGSVNPSTAAGTKTASGKTNKNGNAVLGAKKDKNVSGNAADKAAGTKDAADKDNAAGGSKAAADNKNGTSIIDDESEEAKSSNLPQTQNVLYIIIAVAAAGSAVCIVMGYRRKRRPADSSEKSGKE